MLTVMNQIDLYKTNFQTVRFKINKLPWQEYDQVAAL
jgi:hypothetical protein